MAEISIDVDLPPGVTITACHRHGAGDNIPFHYAGFAGRARQAAPGTDALYV